MPRALWPRATLALVLCLATAMPATARERIELRDGWRFHRGDPPGATAQLMYDVRPEVTASADGKAADAQPEAAAQTTVSAAAGGLKPWVLPSANALIRDPARRHRRPDGHPGSDVAFVQPSFDDSGWQAVSLPHDWAIAGPFLQTGPYGGMGRLQTWGPVWYRRALDIPASDEGRSLFLDVDGAMSYATVWLNGRLVGGWPYGYNSFRLNLTRWARPGGANQLVIRLDNPPESARWYPGAGLYRKVWLTTTHPVHVAHWGTRITTTPQVSAQQARVDVEVRVDNDGAEPARVALLTEVFELGANGRPQGAAVARDLVPALAVPAGGQAVATQSLQLASPKLWGPRPQQQPHRYVAITRLSDKAGAIDRDDTPFGIRTLRFDANTGLHVNGQPVKLQGVNLHHDLGALGAAFNTRAAERQLQIMQAMGANAVRLAHNPPAAEFLDLCDRLGLLVVDEIFDAWERKKTPLDFHLIFPEWHEPDLRAMLRRDRNHPSVVLWSIGNEVGEQYTGEAGAAIARRLHAIVREEDPTRPTTTAMNFAKADMPLPAEVDVISLNYQGEGIRQDPEFIGTDRIRTPPQYPSFHAKFPDKLILSSETASAFSSRGAYLFPVTPAHSSITRDGRGGDSKARQVSGYELYAVDFGASADKVFAALDAHPFVAGEFVWTGFDYLGEPTPYYDARSSYSGIVDLAGFPKDRFYLYQSRWRPDLPMAHLLPHWTWPERLGQVTPVHAFTSGDEGELFLNGRSLGKRKKGPGQYRLRWDDVVYEPGELKLLTWRDGKPWATAGVATAGPASALALQADRSALAADGSDLAFVTLRITDAAGRTVPRADAHIRFHLDGPGEIVATDNGDASSFEPFTSPSRPAFNGLALAIVRGRAGAPGVLSLRAEADGLAPARLSITTR